MYVMYVRRYMCTTYDVKSFIEFYFRVEALGAIVARRFCSKLVIHLYCELWVQLLQGIYACVGDAPAASEMECLKF